MRKNSGFTLVELMVAVSILALLLAVAVPTIIKWVPDYRLREAVRDAYSNFQRAKLTAVKENTLCTITFNQVVGGTPYGYVAFVDSDGDKEYDAGERIIATVSWADYNNSVLLDIGSGGATFTNNDDGLPAIAFKPNGLCIDNNDNPGNGTLFLMNTNNTSRSVIVSSTGGIRIN